jgi:putative Holliday junction resolvase
VTKRAHTILCFDIGLKRTGVASGQSLSKTANPAGQLLVSNGRHDWDQLDRIIAQWQPTLIVIGDPKTEDSHLKKSINRFKSHIQQNHKIQLVDVDETLSSNAANIELANRGFTQSRKTELRDQIAACLILQSYFNSNLGGA